MAGIALTGTVPTLLLNIGDWTGAGPDLPGSAHNLMIMTTVALFLGSGMLYFVGRIASWLDERQEARLAALERWWDERLDLAEKRWDDRLGETVREVYSQGCLDVITGRVAPGQRLRPVN